jgi:hypothetical protein
MTLARSDTKEEQPKRGKSGSDGGEPLHDDKPRMASNRGRRHRSRHFAACAAAIRLISQSGGLIRKVVPFALMRHGAFFGRRAAVIEQQLDTTDASRDIGRTYNDKPKTLPHFLLEPGEPKPWSIETTRFTITTEHGQIVRTVYHPHLCLLKLLKDYDSQSVLDIGAGDSNEADIMLRLSLGGLSSKRDSAFTSGRVVDSGFAPAALPPNFGSGKDFVSVMK